MNHTLALTELLGAPVIDSGGAVCGRVREVALAPQEDRAKVAMLVVVPKSSPQAQQTQNLVKDLRRHLLPAATKGTGTTVYVGGSTAGSVDATAYVADRLGVFIGAVIVLSFLLLLVVFRSLLVPLKAAIMNLLSVAAAYGVVALMVEGGWFGGLVGIHDPMPIPSFIRVTTGFVLI